MKKKPLPLIQVDYEKDELTVDSLTVAEAFGRRHGDVVRAVRSLIDDGTLTAEDFVEVSNEEGGQRISASTYTDGWNRKQPIYVLTERGFLIAMPFVGGKKARQGQAALVDAFHKLRRQLNRAVKARGEEQWKIARAEGKEIRRDETDFIKDFVEYAKEQGSRHAANYYQQLTKATYQALFLLDHATKWRGVRDLLDSGQLGNLRTAEVVVRQALREGMDRKLYYKDIYQLAVERLRSLTLILPPKERPGLTAPLLPRLLGGQEAA